ncbi:MAG: hypothetical protein HYW88_01725, partial [Candidatus Sungbacteria bacterium]|nr:hypothetical protein [Candidatus Sungbacteria bacterium]
MRKRTFEGGFFGFLACSLLAWGLLVVSLMFMQLLDSIWIASDFQAVYTASANAGEEVVVYEPDDADWLGQSGHVKEKLVELIKIARKDGIMDESILPIRIGADRYWIIGASAHAEKNSLLFAKRVIRHGGINLERTITHEFAHLL